MKIAAHPLVVAVALGFLDPQVLATDGPLSRGRIEQSPAPDGEPDGDPDLGPDDFIEPSEFARIEAEWQQVRDLV